MRIPIICPSQFSTKSDHTAYLLANKDKMIAQKKSMQITADPVSYQIPITKDLEATKANLPVEANEFTGMVEFIGNTHNWLDSHLDVLITGSANKTVKENGKNVFHLASHMQDWNGIIGENKGIEVRTFMYSDLGIKGVGMTESVVMKSQLDPTLNDNAKLLYNMYMKGKVKQHSIGLRYIKIDMAINDQESLKEYEFWNKYYEIIINKEKADQYGYFWVVSEYKLLEISAVLWGSNEITPTLNNNVKEEPLEDTLKEPIIVTPQFDISKAIKETTFKF